jgi:RNA polymerase sigma-70 factor (ECF subfamily)
MDAEGFDKLYAASLPRLVGALYDMTGDLPQAQAVVQEAFVRAWDRRARLGVNPEVWVRATAWRLAASRWRRARSAIAGGGPARASAIDPPDLPNQELGVALRRLPQAQRHAIVLFYLCDRSVDQIANETGAQVGTVTARLSHGRATLAKSLTGYLTAEQARG